MSLMLYTQSAIIHIPGLSSMQFNSLDIRVNSTSDIEPIYSGERNDTQPLGVHPIKNLAVLWCL